MPTSSGAVAIISCTKAEADLALEREDPFGEFESPPVLVAAETDKGWELRLYCQQSPAPQLLQRLQQLAPSAVGMPTVEPLPDEDWVTLSQADLEPVNIGRFHIHTSNWMNRARPDQWPIRIDAGLAFGTGQHATTSGCIETATEVAKAFRKQNILDIGTGSGLLAIAATRLFPDARVTATDIDPVAIRVATENAVLNDAPIGHGKGAIAFQTAPGVQHELISGRAPYDLIFANILAEPLLQMAASISDIVDVGGHLILAGLLARQAPDLVAAYGNCGLQLVRQSAHEEWPTLLLQKASLIQ